MDEECRELVTNVRSNTKTYARLFANVCVEIIKDDYLSISAHETHLNTASGNQDIASQAPTYLHGPRVFFVPESNYLPIKMRDIRAEHIGSYVTFKGLCTRVGDVKPLIEVAFFTCESCRAEVRQVANNYIDKRGLLISLALDLRKL